MIDRKLGSFLLGLTVALVPANAVYAEDEEKLQLEPLGGWQLDMAEHKCRLARAFGSEDFMNVFYLEQWNPSQAADWAVAGPALKQFRPGRDVSFVFGSGGDVGNFEMSDASLGELGKLVGGHTTVVAKDDQSEPADGKANGSADPRGLPRLDSEAATKITRLTVSQKGRMSVTFQLAEMEKPLAALNTCMDDLVEHWGFELETQRAITLAPRITNLEQIAERIRGDYPSDALRKGAQASFFLRLTIGEAGEVKGCNLVNQTVADDFDISRKVCGLIERIAQAEPALDAQGQPLASYYTTRIRYVIQ